jgi:2-amino-4-hydroxy-6-hydroxymethyldihydropteridine diphosphokinase
VKGENRETKVAGRKGERPKAQYPALVTAYIALGSNLRDPPAQIRSALSTLAAMLETRLVRHSSFYRNPPVGYLDQPEFVNAVAEIRTRLAPRDLLDQVLALERNQGRTRDFANAPRTIDLDILLYGGHVVNEPGLVIPHPRMLERAFVLVPLAEIAPDAIVPGQGRVSDLAKKVHASGLVRIAEASNA